MRVFESSMGVQILARPHYASIYEYSNILKFFLIFYHAWQQANHFLLSMISKNVVLQYQTLKQHQGSNSLTVFCSVSANKIGRFTLGQDYLFYLVNNPAFSKRVIITRRPYIITVFCCCCCCCCCNCAQNTFHSLTQSIRLCSYSLLILFVTAYPYFDRRIC